MPPIRREQGDHFESINNTRQDRNTFLTGGGTWTWSPSTDTLSWSQDLDVCVANLGTVTLTSGSRTLLASGECWYVIFDRALGTVSSSGVATPGDDVLEADNVLVLGVRGPDDRFYMRDGTVFAEGDVSALGAWSPSVDREVIEGTGLPTMTLTTMTYVYGSGQLLVVVGGIVQELGTHYEEVDAGDISTDITFYDDFVPGVDERVVFMTLTGGRGVPTANSRQDTYDLGPVVLALAAAPFENRLTDGTDATVLEKWGGEASPDNEMGLVRKDATWRGRAFQTRDATDLDHHWEQVSLAGNIIFWNSDSLNAFRLRKDGGGFDFGTMNAGGTVFTLTAQPAGSVGTQPGARVMCFEGTLSNSGPTQIPWSSSTRGIPYGIMLLAFNNSPAIQKYVAVELSGFATGGSEILAMYDDVADLIVIAGSLTGADVVGANYQNQAYRMTVFY